MTEREANNAEGAKQFARQLHGRFHLPVHMADERLTSREAWAQLGREAGKDPTQGRLLRRQADPGNLAQ